MGKSFPVHIWIFHIIIFSFVLSCKNLFAQSVEDSLVNSFNRKLSPQIKLFNGVSYLGYFGKLEGNAYIDDNTEFQSGTIVYDGFEFKDVPILFDLVEEKVVTLSHDGYNWYSLLNERLASFSIQERKFINIFFSDLKDASNKKSGIFQLMYGGKIKVLIKRIKSVKEIIEVHGTKKIFYQKTEYFILKDNQLYKVSSENGFLHLFGQHKVGLKMYLRSKKLNFSEDPIKTLVSLVSYYEQLSN